MPRIADYIVHPGSGKILTGGDIDVVFAFGGIGAGGVGTNCILGFMANTENSNNLKVECRLSTTNQVIYNYGPTDTNITRFFQEVFDGLTVSGPNNLTFKIIGGTGSFSIANLVIWFQRDI